jgi:hypothetical protein
LRAAHVLAALDAGEELGHLCAAHVLAVLDAGEELGHLRAAHAHSALDAGAASEIAENFSPPTIPRTWRRAHTNEHLQGE